MLNESSWAQFKEFYSKKFSVNPLIIEYIAVQDILELCAKGYCNNHISNQLDLEIEYIEEVLKEFYRFSGFDVDIDFDVTPIYDRYRYNKYLFCTRAHELDRQATPLTINELYRINNIYKRIESEINSYYARA